MIAVKASPSIPRSYEDILGLIYLNYSFILYSFRNSSLFCLNREGKSRNAKRLVIHEIRLPFYVFLSEAS